MTITVTDFINVKDRVIELGCKMPVGIAVLPENFGTAGTRQELLDQAEAATLRTLFRNNGFPLDSFLPAEERISSRHNKHFEWAPLLFISGAILSSDPSAVSIALGIISNYATDFFKGLPNKKVKFSIVVEKNAERVSKKIDYEGDVAGLASLEGAIRRIVDEQ